jgi:rhamnose transport system ATP-binding protein
VGSADAGSPVVRVRGLSKDYPPHRVLHGVDLDLVGGQVHALVGENGAGKSTLIKALAGLHAPTEGSIEVRGVPVSFGSPVDSQRAGIAVISQELELVPTMTIAENIFLAHELRSRWGTLDRPRMRRRTAELLATVGLAAAPNKVVGSLPVADQQLVEIAKALSFESGIVILDEPTAALSSADVTRLFAVIAELRRSGTAILYVSHRLHEIIGIAQRVTVLRDGHLVASGPIADYDESSLAEAIVGRAVDQVQIAHTDPGSTAETAELVVRSLSAAGVLDDVSFSVRRGEVVGIAGLLGSGRAEASRALLGIYRDQRGTIAVGGVDRKITSPRRALQVGIAALSEDRKAHGVFREMSVRDNLVIGRQRAGRGIIRRRPEERFFRGLRDQLRIQARKSGQLIESLSGGNQQKVLLARALATDAPVIVLNEPTRGVDVGAKAEIHLLIRRLAEQGRTIVVSSSDVPELVSVSDCCLVMCQGRIVATLRGADIDEATIVRYALGSAAGTNGDGRGGGTEMR